MFDLEAALREWRSKARVYSLSATELDELEDHLYSAYLAHRKRGTAPGEAFAVALRTLGEVEHVSAEYRKVRTVTWIRLLKASWAAFGMAFLLPVVDGGVTLVQPDLGEGLLPGFQAIRFALEEGGWYAISALTNVFMVATMWHVTTLGRMPAAFLGVAVFGSALLNALWLTEYGAFTDLRVGYYLWWASFGLASAALLIRARALSRTSAPSVVAT